jgi:ABC-2 type transport system ATP-binding protein
MIEVKDLTKKFNGKEALCGVSFHVKEGDIMGYLGPNGAGKTTTMRIILGLLKPTSGKALVWGQYLGESIDLRRKVGVLLEQDGLYERISAYENLYYYSGLYNVPDRRKKIKDLLEFTGLSEVKNNKVGTFSKGMKRKLGLARAIIHSPEVLFLDEPSAGLDPEAQKMVRDLILRLSEEEKITIFLNSHDLDEVQRTCSVVAILKEGKIKAYDTLKNLRGKSSGPTVEISIPDNEEIEEAFNLTSSLDTVIDCRRYSEGLTVTLAENTSPSIVLSSLVEKGIKIEEMKRVTKSLEDIYLETVHTEERHE